MQQIFFFTLFFLLVGAGGLISFCRILRHISVMFSTTTGVFMLTDMRNRLRATYGEGVRENKTKDTTLFSRRLLTALIQQNLFQNNIRGKKKKR